MKLKKKLEQFRLPEELVKQLNEFSAIADTTKTQVVIDALRDYMVSGTMNRQQAALDRVKEYAEKINSPAEIAVRKRRSQIAENAQKGQTK